MKTSIGLGFAAILFGRAGGGSGNKAAIYFTPNPITLLTVGLIFSALLGFAQPAGAAEQKSFDDSYSALANFVQQIGAERPKLIAASGKSKSADDSYSALANFVQRLGAEQPKLIAASEQSKSADDSYSALADFVQRLGAEQPKLAAAEKSKTDPWDITGSAKQKGPVKAVKAKPGDDGADAIYIGSKRCLDCHSGQAAEFDKTLMGRIGKTKKGTMECENCHGPGSAHVKAGGGRGVGGIISFRKEDTTRTAEENNTICLSCHQKGDRTYWNGSTHETRGLACTNCHTIMKSVSRKSQLKTAVEVDTCFQCHQDRRAQMARSSHMPLREGKMTCTNCHNPHGSTTEALLKQDSVNDNCYSCHAEKRGPFLFEHLPVRENCLSCHDAHGSVNENLLKVMRPRLCLECHGFGHRTTDTMKQRGAFSRACMNCHTKIHGSNHPAGFVFQR